MIFSESVHYSSLCFYILYYFLQYHNVFTSIKYTSIKTLHFAVTVIKKGSEKISQKTMTKKEEGECGIRKNVKRISK